MPVVRASRIIGKAIDCKTSPPKLAQYELLGSNVARLRSPSQQAPEGTLSENGKSSLELGATVVGHTPPPAIEEPTSPPRSFGLDVTDRKLWHRVGQPHAITLASYESNEGDALRQLHALVIRRC